MNSRTTWIGVCPRGVLVRSVQSLKGEFNGQPTENTPETEREERIREHAHSLWEQDSRPEGKEKEHWQRAVFELEGEAPTTASSKNTGNGSTSTARLP